LQRVVYPLTKAVRALHVESLAAQYELPCDALKVHLRDTHGYNLAMACTTSCEGKRIQVYYVRFSHLLGRYQHCIRRGLRAPAAPARPLVPGNSPRGRADRAMTRSTSDNFFWNRWTESSGMHLFVAKHGAQPLLVAPNHSWPALLYNDVRLTSTDDGRIFAHSSSMSSLCEEDFRTRQTIVWWTCTCWRDAGSFDDASGLYNATLLRPPLRGETVVTVLDWFRDGQLTVVDMRRGRALSAYEFPRDRRTLIAGVRLNRQLGSSSAYLCATEPIFSFSTNTIDAKVQLGGVWRTGRLGVGHVKVESGDTMNLDAAHYTQNAPLEAFRKHTHRLLQERFGTQYIEYQGRTPARGRIFGYIYCLYWYFIALGAEAAPDQAVDTPLNEVDTRGQRGRRHTRGNAARMWISDAFLPISHQSAASSRRKYKFSLFFPVSLLEAAPTKRHKARLQVTGGEGDFYCAALHFDRDAVLNAACLRHDVTAVDIARDYRYHHI
jgi:hypothetical protein